MRGHAFRPFGGDQLAVLAGAEPRQDDSCFSDDVIVDFPSVVPALDRMRRGFLGDERPATLNAAIQLSRRDARLGATVPFDVPVACTCTACGGRGESWTVPCVRCNGSGTELLRHPLQVTIPAGVPDGARFLFTVTPRHHPSTRIELLVQFAD
jgi:hypothetical protein